MQTHDAPEEAPTRTHTERMTALETRMDAFEARLSGSGGDEPSIKELLETVQRTQTAHGVSLSTLVECVGEAPDLSLDKPGSGMRKQVASLVEATRRPTIASYVAAIFTGLLTVYQVLKSAGVLK